MPVRPRDRRVLAFACALWGGTARAWAGPPQLHVALDYQTDPSLGDCPSATELSAAIATQLGYDPFAPSPTSATHRLKASIVRTAGGTEAHIEWLGEAGNTEGERRLKSESQDCAEVARGLSFAIAVQLQLRASEAAPPPAPPPPAPEPAPANVKVTPAPAPKQSWVMVGAGALVQRGVTPGTSPGLRVFGALGNPRGSLEVSTEATLPSDLSFADNTGFTARELGVKAAPCLRFGLAGICAVGLLGQLHVRGEGVDRVQSPSSVLAGAGARLQLVWPALPTFGALLQAEALVLLTPRTVQLNQADVWSTAPVVLGASLDLAAIFR